MFFIASVLLWKAAIALYLFDVLFLVELLLHIIYEGRSHQLFTARVLLGKVVIAERFYGFIDETRTSVSFLKQYQRHWQLVEIYFSSDPQEGRYCIICFIKKVATA